MLDLVTDIETEDMRHIPLSFCLRDSPHLGFAPSAPAIQVSPEVCPATVPVSI